MTVSALRSRRAKPGATSPRTRFASPGATVSLLLALLMVVVGAVLARYVTQVTEWRVMRDELGYIDLARGFADRLSPLPVIHGERVPLYSVLYPLIISPFAGSLDAPAAFQAIRVVNVVVMVSTAIPAYLLAREASSSRAAGLIAATLSVLVPWMAQSTSLMTEVAGYPAYAWAVYAMTRAIARPSPARDVVALAAIAVACLARTQFTVLLLAFPVAALVHELGRRVAVDGVRNVRSVLVGGTREALRAHVVVAFAGGVGAVLLAFASSVLLGGYSVTTGRGGIVPAGLPGSALDHLAYIAVGVGAVPLVFALALVFGTLGRPVDPRPHALASVLVVVVLVTTLVVASFDLRFVIEGREVQERYLFYICPLLFAGAATWFVQGRTSPLPTAIATLATAGVVLSQTYAPQPEALIEGFASPNRYFFAVLDGRLRQVEGHLGLSSLGPGIAIAATCAIAAAVAVALLRSGYRRVALATFAVLVGAFLAGQLTYVLPRVVTDHNRFTPQLGAPPLASRDWVDERVSTSVGAVESTINSRAGRPFFDKFIDSAAWWDLEFWNRSVERVYQFGAGSSTVVPLAPVQGMSLDFASGDIRTGGSGQLPQQLVVATSETRFAPEYRGVPMSNGDLTLYRTPRPYRAGWATQGVDTDGWTTAGRPVIVRVYARRGTGTEQWRLRIRLHGGDDVGGPRRYTITGDGPKRDRLVRTNATARFNACPPPGGHADVSLDIHGRTQQGPRQVGLQMLLVRATPTGRPCRPA